MGCAPPGAYRYISQAGGGAIHIFISFSTYSISSVARATRTLASLPAGVRARESCWLASPRKTPHVACCCVLCGCSRCSRSRVRCRVAMLSHAFAEVLARSCVWRLAKCFAEHCAKLSHGENLWLLCCWACVHHGRSVISRIAHRARMRERAGLRLLGGVCCVFVLLLVLCAIVGTQHSNQHSCVLAAAGVLPGRIATAMCARGGRIRFA